MPRSSDHRNIFRDHPYPFMAGRLPSKTGGRVLDTSVYITPEGKFVESTHDRGRISESNDNHFYVYLAGREIPMNEAELRECVESMQDTKRRKAERDPRYLPTWKEIREYVQTLKEMLADEAVGRRRF